MFQKNVNKNKSSKISSQSAKPLRLIAAFLVQAFFFSSFQLG